MLAYIDYACIEVISNNFSQSGAEFDDLVIKVNKKKKGPSMSVSVS